MTDFHLAIATAEIGAGSSVAAVYTGLKDPSFEPVVIVTPRGDNSNENLHVGVPWFSANHGWIVHVRRSIGSDVAVDADACLFSWRTIAMKTVPEIGPTVVPAIEPS